MIIDERFLKEVCGKTKDDFYNFLDRYIRARLSKEKIKKLMDQRMNSISKCEEGINEFREEHKQNIFETHPNIFTQYLRRIDRWRELCFEYHCFRSLYFEI